MLLFKKKNKNNKENVKIDSRLIELTPIISEEEYDKANQAYLDTLEQENIEYNRQKQANIINARNAIVSWANEPLKYEKKFFTSALNAGDEYDAEIALKEAINRLNEEHPFLRFKCITWLLSAEYRGYEEERDECEKFLAETEDDAELQKIARDDYRKQLDACNKFLEDYKEDVKEAWNLSNGQCIVKWEKKNMPRRRC